MNGCEQVNRNWTGPFDGEPRRWNIRVQPTTQFDYVTVFATCAS